MIFDRVFLKRRYFEARAGNTVISPIISASTFVGVAYLYIKDIMPFYYFLPIFFISMVTLVTIIGLKFRTIQLTTDENMKYEKQTELNKTLYLIMEALNKQEVQSHEFLDRMAEVKRIAGI